MVVTGLPDFSWYNIPKRGKIYQITIKIPNGKKLPYCRKIDQMAIKCTSNFHCKTLQNLPKLVFLVCKQTIWQPWIVGMYTYLQDRATESGLAASSNVG
jgi:hypothetical protein